MKTTDANAGETRYGYDSRDNLTIVTDANNHTHTFTYDKTNQVRTEARPLGATIRYDYDAAGTNNGLLKTASLPGTGGRIDWQAYQWQQPTKIAMPGATRTLAYDALQRPTRITSQAIGSGTNEAPTGEIVMDYRYTYDAAGNITRKETEEGAYHYGYDLIDRLTSATPPQELQQDPANPDQNKLPIEAYSYDPVHNRLSSQHQPGPWDYNADNQLQDYGIGPERHTFTYNPNGHTATEVTGDPATKTREFLYNAAERLTEIKDNQQTIGQYQYDPMGRRIRKQTQEGTIWFLYADEGLIAELDQTGNPTRYYGWKPNGLWGTDPVWLAEQTSTWQAYLYHNDHLWTPQRLTNTQGEIQWSGRAEAFGKTAATTNLIDNPLRFPGQYLDAESKQHYNYFRDYQGATGTYVQSDPIGMFGSGVNFYAYGKRSPQLAYDSLGLKCEISGVFISVPEYNFNVDACRNGVWSCLGYKFPSVVTVDVSAEGTARITVGCKSKCDCADVVEWSFDASVDAKGIYSVPIPLPTPCRLIRGPRLQLTCVLAKFANWSVTVKQAEQVAMDAIKAMLQLDITNLDPKSLCESSVLP